MGPGPRTGQHSYASAMTNDHTPMEISLCWKSQSQNGVPIVRYVFDIAAEDGNTRQSSLKQGEKAIEALRVAVAKSDLGGIKLDLFCDLWAVITSSLLLNDGNIHPSTPCAPCGPGSTFIGFDLAPKVLRSKLYWLLPACQSNMKLSQFLDETFQACVAANDFFRSSAFQDGWGIIRNHFALHSDTLRPRMISVDATQFPTPRVKLYVRCLLGDSLDFSAIEPHLTLQGKLVPAPHFLSVCRNLWTALTSQACEKSLAPPPKYCMILYEFTGGSISSKLYIMCQEIPRSDSFIASKLLSNCPAMKDAAILNRMVKHSKPTAYINEIGLASRKDETEVSIYLNPCIFSRKEWEEAQDGLLLKQRIGTPGD
jgi:DMATS type aromatic prenyltransferase